MGGSGLYDGPLAPVVWFCAVLLLAGTVLLTVLLPAYWRGGDGWVASRIEGASGSVSKYPSGAHALVPFTISMWGFAIAAIFTAMATVGGFGEEGDPNFPWVVGGALLMAMGFGLQQMVVWFNRPKFLVPPRWRDDPGEWARRRARRG